MKNYDITNVDYGNLPLDPDYQVKHRTVFYLVADLIQYLDRLKNREIEYTQVQERVNFFKERLNEFTITETDRSYLSAQRDNINTLIAQNKPFTVLAEIRSTAKYIHNTLYYGEANKYL